MPKRSSKQIWRDEDENTRAKAVIDEIIAETEREGSLEPSRPKKNPSAVALGRLGGLKGGKARAEKLSAIQRSKIAKAAAAARWKKRGL